MMPRKHFEAAKAINDNATVKANLGAVALAQGDLKTAEELLTACYERR